MRFEPNGQDAPVATAWRARPMGALLLCAFGLSLIAGCGGASGGDATGGQTGGQTGGSSGSGGLSGGASGGSTSPASGTGGASPVGTGGSSSSASGGATSSTGGAAASSGGSAGTSTNTGGSSSGGMASASGGSTGAGGATSSSGGSTGGGGKVASTGGSAGATSGGSGGAGGALPPPVRDAASKVPISSSPGYTVEGNYIYGPSVSQRLDIIYPTGAGPKGTQILPMVIMFHGGAWIHSYNNGSGKDHMSTFFDRFLSHGFMVCNAEYRVNDGTSADSAVAPAAVQDALLAAKWCWDYMDYFHGDRTKYVVTGASAGGHLALMVGMTTPDAMLGPTSPADFKIAGIVDGYGPADIVAEINAVAAGWLPNSLPNRLDVAKLVSPMTYVRKDIPPLIVVQGANDHTAPVADSMHLVSLLTAAGADAMIHLVPNTTHGFTDVASAWPDAEMAMFNWLTSKGIGK